MSREAASALQLPLFVSESSVAQDVLARYEAIRPVLTGQRPLVQQSQQTGMNSWRLWRDLRRFRRAGRTSRSRKSGSTAAIPDQL